MRHRVSSLLVCAGLCAGLSLTTTPSWAAPRKRPPPPKLIVLMAVDQMRADYYDWYGARWKGGLKRLFSKGAWLVNARFPFLNTVTCPGHATVGTGSYPRTHGMILNSYYDRALKKVVECTDDPEAPLVGHGPGGKFKGGDSARRLMAPTLGDEMKAQLKPGARVVGLSFKARSAIGLAGQAPDALLWFESGAWVTSSKFSATPHPWVERFVTDHPIAARVAEPWTKLLPASAYRFTDDGEGENPPKGWKRTFPHRLTKEGSPNGEFGNSPLPDEYLVLLARAAVAELKLGKGPGTDLLAISFSMTDIIGHRFGPRSHEVQDVLARLDRSVGQLLAMLDREVGRGRYVVGMSADHGVADLPEQMKAEGKDAGRLSATAIKKTTGEAVAAELGPGKYVSEVQANEIYLTPGVHEKLLAKEGAVARVLATVRAMPGVADAFHAGELLDPEKAADPVRRAAALGHYPGRSGDLSISPKPGWFVGAEIATTHGSVHDYDQRVPVLFYGAGIKPGRYARAASPADVAPTLGKLIGVTMPKAEGQVIVDVLRAR